MNTNHLSIAQAYNLINGRVIAAGSDWETGHPAWLELCALTIKRGCCYGRHIAHRSSCEHKQLDCRKALPADVQALFNEFFTGLAPALPRASWTSCKA